MFLVSFLLPLSLCIDHQEAEYYESPEQPPTGKGFAGEIARQLDSALQKAQEKYPEQFYIIHNITQTFQTALNETLLFPSLNPLKPHVKQALCICSNLIDASKKIVLNQTVGSADQISKMVSDLGLDQVATSIQSLILENTNTGSHEPAEDLNESIHVLKNVSKTASKMFKAFGKTLSKSFKQQLYEAGLVDDPPNMTQSNETEDNETAPLSPNELIPVTVNAINQIARAAYLIFFNQTTKYLNMAHEILGDTPVEDIKDAAQSSLKMIESQNIEPNEEKQITYKDAIKELKNEAIKARNALFKAAKKTKSDLQNTVKEIINDAFANHEEDESDSDEDDEDEELIAKRVKSQIKDNKNTQLDKEREEKQEKAKQEHLNHAINKQKLKLKNLLKQGIKAVKQEAKKINAKDFLKILDNDHQPKPEESEDANHNEDIESDKEQNEKQDVKIF